MKTSKFAFEINWPLVTGVSFKYLIFQPYNQLDFQDIFSNCKYSPTNIFLNPNRDDVDVEVIFLNKEEPNLEFEGLLKRESTRVQYFR